MKISLIVAMAENRVIGRRGKLPWRIPEDMKHFRKLTMGKPIIMGRKTFEAIGAALPGRTNIVITRGPGIDHPNLIVAASVHGALSLAENYGDEVMIIGGGEIYAAALPLADRIYLTEVHENIEGDASFPPLDRSLWAGSGRQDFEKSGKIPAFSFVTLNRK